MGTDVINISPDPLPTAWEGLDDPRREGSIVPRGEVTFFMNETVIPDPGVGDDTFVNVTCLLPKNFAYAFADAGVRIIQSVANIANTWDDVGELSITNNEGGTPTRNFYSEMASNGKHFGGAFRGASKAYCPVCPSTAVFVSGEPDQQIGMHLTFANIVTNHGACTMTLLARVWQYDVSQANHWQPNTPTLVRS